MTGHTRIAIVRVRSFSLKKIEGERSEEKSIRIHGLRSARMKDGTRWVPGTPRISMPLHLAACVR